MSRCPWTQCLCPLYSPGVCERDEWRECVLVLAARAARRLDPGRPPGPRTSVGEEAEKARVPAAAPGDGDDGLTSSVNFEGLRLLTRREREVVRLLLEGERVASIAVRLHLSVHTVRNHVRSILRKLEIDSQVTLVRLYSVIRDVI